MVAFGAAGGCLFAGCWVPEAAGADAVAGFGAAAAGEVVVAVLGGGAGGLLVMFSAGFSGAGSGGLVGLVGSDIAIPHASVRENQGTL